MYPNVMHTYIHTYNLTYIHTVSYYIHIHIITIYQIRVVLPDKSNYWLISMLSLVSSKRKDCSM